MKIYLLVFVVGCVAPRCQRSNPCHFFSVATSLSTEFRKDLAPAPLGQRGEVFGVNGMTIVAHMWLFPL